MSVEAVTDPAQEVAARLPVTDRRLWLWLIAIGLLVIGGLLWLALGSAPATVTGRGMIVPAGGFTDVGTEAEGRVTQILVAPGQPVQQGEVVARITDSRGTTTDLTSPEAGRVATILERQGGTTEAGNPVLTIDPSTTDDVTTGFLPADQASRVKPGMRALVAVSTAPKSEYGSITGVVTQVSTLPTTADRIRLVVGGNDTLPTYVLAAGPVLEVTVKLDSSTSTPSGYVWTSGDGQPEPLKTGTLAEVTVILADNTLLSRLAR